MHARTATATGFDIANGRIWSRVRATSPITMPPPADPGMIEIDDAGVVRVTVAASLISAACAVAGLFMALSAG